MNNVILIGNLVRDIELKYFDIEKGKIASASFTLAVMRNENKTDFIDCKIVGKGAEILSQYTRKGKRLSINRKIQIDEWEKDGARLHKTYIFVEKFVLPEKDKVEPQLKPSEESVWDSPKDIDTTDNLPFY